MILKSWLNSVAAVSSFVARRGWQCRLNDDLSMASGRRGIRRRSTARSTGSFTTRSIVCTERLEDRTLLSAVTSVVMSGPGITNGTGDLNAGKTVTLTVNFDSPVVLDNTNGDPTLSLNDGSTAGVSNFNPGTSLTFSHFILPGENVDDLAVTAFNLNGSTIKSGNVDADLSGAVSNPSGTLKIDTTDPTYSVSLIGAATESAGTQLQYLVTFSEAVTGVDTNQFTLTTTGVTGASISSVSLGVDAAHYYVNVNSGTGVGSIGLNVVPVNVIDLAGNPVAGQLSFASQQTFATGTFPISVAIGDVNGDGKPDLAITNEMDSTVSVLLGNGNGTFSTQQTYSTGGLPFSVVLGDVNGDHKQDLIVACESGGVSVLLGNGNGTFAAQHSYATGGNPDSVTLGDVNGDGKVDLITANRGDDDVSVLLGNGNGTFAAQQTFATGSFPYSPAIGDVNGDGKLDLVVANSRSNTISVLLGNGDGTFATQQTFATGTFPNSVVLSDVNGDGKLDAIVPNLKDGNVSVLLGNGNGTFAPQQKFATGSYPNSVQVGDVNGDGKPDLIVTNETNQTIGVLLGNGKGGFAPQQEFATGNRPFSAIFGDVNGDGKPDLIVPNFNDGTVGVLLNQTPPPLAFTIVADHAPVGTSTTVTTLEDTNYVFTEADFGFSDPNDVPFNFLSAVMITTLPATGTLTDNGVGVTAGQFVSVADISAGKLVFAPAANANGAANASFTFQVQDDGQSTGGSANLDPTPKTMTVNVTSVNDAPVGTSTTVTALEDTGYIFGTTDFGFTDPNDSPANALLAVLITTLPANGALTDDGIAVTAGQFVSVADIAAGKLVFTPAANASGAAYGSFTFRVQDNGGTANGGVDLDPTPKTMTINVTSVNDAPSGASGAVTLFEDHNYVVQISDFGFSDTNDSPANHLLAVKFDIVSAYGTFTDNGVTVANNAFVSAADISQGKLVFTPAANLSGGPYFFAKFQVQDDGGTANGGVDLDPTGRVLTFQATAVNDPPMGTSSTVNTFEDQGYVLKTSDFGFSDPNDHPANQLLAVKFDIVSAYGTLTDNGVAVTANQVVSALDIAQGKLVFTSSANLNGGPYFLAKFQVQDNGGTANGGIDLDPNGAVLTFKAASVNDAPRGTSGTVTTTNGQGYVLKTSDFGFTDPNDHPANQLLAVKFDIVSAYGTLTDNGVAVTANQFVSALDISHGKLVFTPSANIYGGPYFLAKFQVQDDGGTANGGVDLDPNGQVLTFNSLRVNHAPVGTSGTVTMPTNNVYVMKTSDFGFTDPNDNPANQLLAVKVDIVSAYGTLTDNGVAVTANQSISAQDISSGKVVFTAAANMEGGTFFLVKFQVQDNGGTANGGADLDPNGKVLNFKINKANHAPTGTSATVTTREDQGYVLKTSDFGFSDPNDTPPNQFKAVRFVLLSAYGTLTDNGVAVTVDQTVSVSDISQGKLVFTPTANLNGGPYFLAKFQVQDDGGEVNGGQDYDQNPKVLTYIANSVNDAPVGTSHTISVSDNSPISLPPQDFGFTDPNDTPANHLRAVKITTLPAFGTLTDNGVPVTAGQFISVADLQAGKLVLTPALGFIGTSSTSFTFQVQDDGGTANGGIDLDATPRLMTVNLVTLPPVTLGNFASTSGTNLSSGQDSKNDWFWS